MDEHHTRLSPQAFDKALMNASAPGGIIAAAQLNDTAFNSGLVSGCSTAGECLKGDLSRSHSDLKRITDEDGVVGRGWGGGGLCWVDDEDTGPFGFQLGEGFFTESGVGGLQEKYFWGIS